MNVWDILQIEPTDDKRVIKKAYARRSREIHPEEKPEEFKQLYEAYQSALKYAQVMGWGETKPEGLQEPREEPWRQSEEVAGEEGEEEASGLYSYFSERQKILQEQRAEFQRQWEEVTRGGGSPPSIQRWEEYLKSEGFQEIRWDPKVLEISLRKLRQSSYSLKIKLALWDAYAFAEGAQFELHGDSLNLYHQLLPSYELRKRDEIAEQKRLQRMEEEKRREAGQSLLFRGIIVACSLVLVLALYSRSTQERRFVLLTMQNRYPADSFTTPKKEKGADSEYLLYSRNHPEFQIRARVLSGSYRMNLRENYGMYLLQNLSDLYGLEWESGADDSDGTYTIYHSDIEDIDRMCDSLYRMLEEEGEGVLSFLKYVKISLKGALYPEPSIYGDIKEPSLSRMYEVKELPEKEVLSQTLKEDYVDYMYNYEAWNLNPNEMEDYRRDYVARGRAEREGQEGSLWSWDKDVREMEEAFDLYIPIHIREEGSSMDSSFFSSYRKESFVTVGNAYQLLKASGNATLIRNRQGFAVVKNGTAIIFGRKEMVSLELVKELME